MCKILRHDWSLGLINMSIESQVQSHYTGFQLSYEIAALGFKCMYGSATSYLQNLVEFYASVRTLRNSSDKLISSISEMRILYSERF